MKSQWNLSPYRKTNPETAICPYNDGIEQTFFYTM